MSLKTEAPLKLGISELNPSLVELQDYIDWMPYFNAWEFSGRFPDLLSDPSKGPEARKLQQVRKTVLRRVHKQLAHEDPLEEKTEIMPPLSRSFREFQVDKTRG